MFTATPPSVNRRRSGGGRRSAGDRELPYVAIKNNYSYGSQFSNMPKPPQLAETKVPLSVALKQQQDASNARMRAEQLERERISREQDATEPEDHRRSDPGKAAPGKKLQKELDLTEGILAQQKTGSLRSRSVASVEPITGVSSSMPPPPPRRISPRIQSEVSDHSYSVGFDTNLGMSRSYASEDDVGIVLGRKFTQNLADLPDDADDLSELDDLSSTDEDDPIDDAWLGTSLRGGETDPVQLPPGLGPPPLGARLPPVKAAGGDAPEPKADAPIPNRAEPEKAEPAKVEEKTADEAKIDEVELDNAKMDEVLIEEVLALVDAPPGWDVDWAFWHWNAWLGRRIRNLTIFLLFAIFCSNIWIDGIDNLFGVNLRNLKKTPFTYIPPTAPPRDFDEIRTRMLSVEKEIGNWGIYYSKFENGYTDMIKGEVDTLQKSIENVRAQGRVTNIQLDAYNKELEKVKGFQEMMKTNQATVSEELATIRKQMNDFMGNLPGKIVATQLDDGSYKLLDTFETILEEVIRKKASTIVSDISAGGVTTTTTIPGWDAFLKQNKLELENLIDQHTGLSLDRKGGVILSHGTVKLLIDQKIKEFEAYKTKTLFPEIRTEATNTAKKYIKENPQSKEIGSTIPYTDPLDHHPDYASQLIGGMIAPFITSPSYDYTSTKDKWFYWFFGRSMGLYPQPAVAITPTKDVGQCWPFAGDSGTIGIRLAKPIFVTHISVEHILPQLAIDISSAPRNMEFWARFDDEHERNRIENAASTASGEIMWGPGRLWDRESMESPEGPSGDVFNNFVKLAAFKYDITRGKPRVQTHQLGVDFANLNITATTVIFRVVSNWGHPTFTCVYQVKVHGTPVNPPKVYQESGIGGGEEL